MYRRLLKLSEIESQSHVRGRLFSFCPRLLIVELFWGNCRVKEAVRTEEVAEKRF